MGSEWEKQQIEKLTSKQQERIDQLKESFLKEERLIAKSEVHNQQKESIQISKGQITKSELTIIVATGENRIIQSPQNAKITQFHVTKNDNVSEGSVIITLSPIQAEASLKELDTRIDNLLARKIRLMGELEGIPLLELSENLRVFPNEIAEAELKSVVARRADLDAQKGLKIEKTLMLEREILALSVQVTGKKELLELINKEKEEIESLLSIGAVGNSEKYKIDREAKSLNLEITNIAENISLKKGEILSIDNELLVLDTSYDSVIIEEMSNIEAKIMELSAKKPAFVERVSNTQIVSPINGKINKLSIKRPISVSIFIFFRIKL